MGKRTHSDRLVETLEQLAKSESLRGVIVEPSPSDQSVMTADVSRSVAFWDVHKHLKIAQRAKKRKLLATLLERISKTLPGFRYYQGIHDVCLVVCEAVDFDLNRALPLTRVLLHLHYGRLMREDFAHSLLPMLRRLEEVVSIVDPALHGVIQESGFGYHFAIPWLLTWFSHSIESFQNVCAVFHHLLNVKSTEAPLLLCAAFLIEGRESVLYQSHDHSRTYQILQGLVNAVPTHRAISRAISLSTGSLSFPSKASQEIRRATKLSDIASTRRVLMVILVGIILAIITRPMADDVRVWFSVRIGIR